MNLVLMLGFLGAAVTAEDVPMRSVVKIEYPTHEFSGYLIDNAPDSTDAIFIGSDGTLRTVPRKELAVTGKAPVADIPPVSLLAGLAHADPFVREDCVRLLVGHRRLESAPLATGLGAQDDNLVLGLIQVMQQRPLKKLEGTVRTLLRHRSATIRNEALQLYAKLEPSDLFLRCGDLLELDRSPLVCRRAVHILGGSEDVRMVDVLFEQLTPETDRSVRIAVFGALQRLTGMRLRRDERRWRNWWTNHRDEILLKDRIQRDYAKSKRG